MIPGPAAAFPDTRVRHDDLSARTGFEKNPQAVDPVSTCATGSA